MKQKLSTICVLMFAIAVNTAIAQDKSLALNSSSFNTDYGIAVYSGHKSDMNATDVNAKALKDFSKTFKNVTDAKWYGVGDGFFASFKDKGIETKAAYDKKGTWHCTVRTLDETQLPSDVKDAVMSEFKSCKILVGYEITHKEGPVYIIKTEDSKSLKILRVNEGEVEIISNNSKG
jgi:hypothetical protein